MKLIIQYAFGGSNRRIARMLSLAGRAAGLVCSLYVLLTTAHAADMTHVRGIHAGGDWGGNHAGFKPPLLSDAGALSVARVSSRATRQGTIDLAEITLNDIIIDGTVALPVAGFYVYQEIATGNIGVQFKPQVDTNLANIEGFSNEEINLLWDSDSNTYWSAGLDSLSDDALRLVLSVLAHAPEMLKGGDYTVSGEAAFGDEESLIEAMTSVRAVVDGDGLYFGFLKSMNAEWIGISVGLHYDSFSDPLVRARNCPIEGFVDSGGHANPCAIADEDLRSFIGRARSYGLKVYMTLAFETSSNIDGSQLPTCGTEDYRMSRWLLGRPEIPEWSEAKSCIAAEDWWWSPAHPDYASNKAIFWNSYTQWAVHYATLAEEAGADMFSLGTEQEFLFRTRPSNPAPEHAHFVEPLNEHFLTELTAMVDSVRGVFSGALTYDQGYDVYTNSSIEYAGGEGNFHIFNDLGLDVVGLSTYFSLLESAPDAVVAIENLEGRWQNIFSTYLVPIKERYPEKPIVLLEFGFTDHVNAAYHPASGEGEFKPEYTEENPTDGMLQQRNLFSSFYSVNAQFDNLVAGTFVWGHDYYPTTQNYQCKLTAFSVLCSPARFTLADAYGNWRAIDTDRIFEWAEAAFPQFFPSGQVSQEALGFRFRYYPQTNTYLAMQDETLYLHNEADWNVLNIGSLREFLDVAGAAGF